MLQHDKEHCGNRRNASNQMKKQRLSFRMFTSWPAGGGARLCAQ